MSELREVMMRTAKHTPRRGTPKKMQDTNNKLDTVIGECNELAPNVIGQMREKIKLDLKTEVDKGYTTA